MAHIKRYSNRKLYDTEARQYVTLEEIGEMIQQGEEITVTDHESGSDITALTLAQILLEQEKKIGGMLPKAILFRLVRFGGAQVTSILGAMHAFLEPTQYVEDEIKRRLENLTKDGVLSDADALSLRNTLLDKRFHEAEPWKFSPGVVESEEQEQLSSTLKQLENQVEKMEKELEKLQNKKQAKP